MLATGRLDRASRRWGNDQCLRLATRQRATPGSRTTQFFINYGDNTRLKHSGAFAPFGEVVEGMDVVDSLHAGYGEGAPSGRGPSQGRIASEGNSYLKNSFPKLDWIIEAKVTSTAGEQSIE